MGSPIIKGVPTESQVFFTRGVCVKVNQVSNVCIVLLTTQLDVNTNVYCISCCIVQKCKYYYAHLHLLLTIPSNVWHRGSRYERIYSSLIQDGTKAHMYLCELHKTRQFLTNITRQCRPRLPSLLHMVVGEVHLDHLTWPPSPRS